MEFTNSRNVRLLRHPLLHQLRRRLNKHTDLHQHLVAQLMPGRMRVIQLPRDAGLLPTPRCTGIAYGKEITVQQGGANPWQLCWLKIKVTLGTQNEFARLPSDDGAVWAFDMQDSFNIFQIGRKRW